MFATYATNLNDDSFYPDQPRLPAQHCEDPCVEVAGQLHPRGRPSEVGSPIPLFQDTPSQPTGF